MIPVWTLTVERLQESKVAADILQRQKQNAIYEAGLGLGDPQPQDVLDTSREAMKEFEVGEWNERAEELFQLVRDWLVDGSHDVGFQRVEWRHVLRGVGGNRGCSGCIEILTRNEQLFRLWLTMDQVKAFCGEVICRDHRMLAAPYRKMFSEMVESGMGRLETDESGEEFFIQPVREEGIERVLKATSEGIVLMRTRPIEDDRGVFTRPHHPRTSS